MSELIVPPTTDVLVEPTNDNTPQKYVQNSTNQNLVKQNKLLSLLAPIYNFQPMGLSLRITLPIETQYNQPLFALKITPLILNLKFYGSMGGEFNTNTGSNRITAWLNNKVWAWVADTSFVASGGSPTPPTGCNFVEKDDIPDIAWLATNHSAWRGSLNYSIRVVSNVTTQGKLAVTRMYDVPQPSLNYNANSYRTLLDMGMSSQSYRMKNSTMLFDLSRATDLVVQCPYVSKRPVRRMADYYLTTNTPANSDQDSWLIFDIINALDTSAGSNELILDFWVQAGPDFELINPIPPRRFMVDGNRADANAVESTMWYTNSFEPVPYVFGQTNSTVTFSRTTTSGIFTSYTVSATSTSTINNTAPSTSSSSDDTSTTDDETATS